MKKIKKTSQGFTIVELLIVVVVIAILAAITVVSYNGISTRAKVARVETELSGLANTLEIFRAERGRFPAVVPSPQAATIPMTEMEDILRQANLFDATRIGVVGDVRNFIYCTNADASDYIIAALQPLYTGDGIPLGSKIYYRSSKYFHEATATTVIATPNVGLKICQSISGDTSFSLGRWAHDIPTPYVAP